MRQGERLEKISTKAHYRVLEVKPNGKFVLERLVNGGNSDSLLEVDDLNAFKVVRMKNGIIEYFDGEYAFLSNLYISNVEYQGIIFPSVEHAFHASKTNDLEERKKILEISSPTKMKVLGKKIKIKDGWNQYEEMYKICLNKFKNNEDLKKRLLLTKDFNLVNSSNDEYWGINNNIGENNLGKILMRIRKELAEEN